MSSFKWYICNNKQTIFDIALELFGSLDGLRILREDNPVVFLHGFPPTIHKDLRLKIRLDSIVDTQVHDRLAEYRTRLNLNHQTSIEGEKEGAGSKLDFFVLNYTNLE